MAQQDLQLPLGRHRPNLQLLETVKADKAVDVAASELTQPGSEEDRPTPDSDPESSSRRSKVWKSRTFFRCPWRRSVSRHGRSSIPEGDEEAAEAEDAQLDPEEGR